MAGIAGVTGLPNGSQWRSVALKRVYEAVNRQPGEGVGMPRIAAEVKAGLLIGTVMATKVRQGPAPSRLAACLMPGGVERKRVWNFGADVGLVGATGEGEEGRRRGDRLGGGVVGQMGPRRPVE
jgi:hypothetical protein